MLTPTETFYVKKNNFIQTSSIGCPLLGFGQVLQLQEFLWIFPTKEKSSVNFSSPWGSACNPERERGNSWTLHMHTKREPCFQGLLLVNTGFSNVLTTFCFEYPIPKVSRTELTCFYVNSVIMESYKLDLAFGSGEQSPAKTLLKCFLWMLCLYVWLREVFNCFCCADK